MSLSIESNCDHCKDQNFEVILKKTCTRSKSVVQDLDFVVKCLILWLRHKTRNGLHSGCYSNQLHIPCILHLFRLLFSLAANSRKCVQGMHCVSWVHESICDLYLTMVNQLQVYAVS